MIKKFYDKCINFIKEEYKTLLFLIVFYFICTFPVNYSIIIGGGTSNIDSRIKVEDSYKSKGGFYISYVSELKGTILSYLASYIIPDAKRVSLDDYKYNSQEDYEDIQFRSDLDLDSASNNAIKVAYSLANKEYEVLDNKIYVTTQVENFHNSLEVGDQIVSINDQSFLEVEQYRNYLQTFDANQEVNVKIIRNNKEKIIQCKIYEEDGRKILGVILQNVYKYKTDPKVNIKFKASESGPSGGLMTTLDIYNKLTKKDLTNSLKIAGTGTVDQDGNVGEIGEVKYKLLGAVDDKMDVFLVPKGNNYNTCKKLKEERNLKIKIIGVSTVEDAIEELKKLD